MMYQQVKQRVRTLQSGQGEEANDVVSSLCRIVVDRRLVQRQEYGQLQAGAGVSILPVP